MNEAGAHGPVSGEEKDGVEIVTFGCRLNTYESEVIRAEAAKAGLGNAILFNTCAVTAEATRQARQAIRRARARCASASAASARRCALIWRAPLHHTPTRSSHKQGPPDVPLRSI